MDFDLFCFGVSGFVIMIDGSEKHNCESDLNLRVCMFVKSAVSKSL